MTLRPFGDVVYIEHSVYASLIDKNFNLTDLVDSFNINKQLSPLTKANIVLADGVIKDTLFKFDRVTDVGYYHCYDLAKHETDYLKTKISNYLKGDTGYLTPQECYDIIPVSNPQAEGIRFVVIVKQGFLSAVTETKEALLEHLLTLLRHLYENNAQDWIVRREYLGLKLNPGYFDLVKLRFEKV